MSQGLTVAATAAPSLESVSSKSPHEGSPNRSFTSISGAINLGYVGEKQILRCWGSTSLAVSNACSLNAPLHHVRGD
ncbi:uncharacterized protein PHALS_11548 [Plasmopara halstedii]|uniref:Uncharacterized protein n=1 Tax=Plasmopara halstedii TaxID=4781 RepID=A0A0P1AKM6_PLAHL|nr:uncharacterized protein PHALS_11548 [Plasmopara halstedii]CEG41183.1 hypothetical protein PHALS_11548 [Plasmopara halstedii]|eukprot:XP_024577552.1 hypothetical protein PHALS_11548 [Plasmopara halstedii]